MLYEAQQFKINREKSIFRIIQSPQQDKINKTKRNKNQYVYQRAIKTTIQENG